MKIVETDNYGGDYPDEKFLTGIPWIPNNEVGVRKAWAICHAIQDLVGNDARRYWKVVPDDYVLAPGFEP